MVGRVCAHSCTTAHIAGERNAGRYTIPKTFRALRMALVGGCGFAVVPIGLGNMQSTQLMTRFRIQEREGKLVKINLERKTPRDVGYRPQPRRMTSYAYSPRLLKAFRLFPKIQAVIDLVTG